MAATDVETEEEAMPFVEVFSPPGTPRPEQRRKIAEELVAEVMAGEGAPDTKFARSISWLVWHDLSAFRVGGSEVATDEPPRYVVRVTVPAPSLTDEKRAEIVRRVTAVLATADDYPSRLYETPSSFVLIEEIPDGNWGGIGRVVRFNEIASYVMTGEPTPMSDEDVQKLVDAGPTWSAPEKEAVR